MPKISKLLSSSFDALNQAEFGQAISFALEILKLDPESMQAKEYLAYAYGNQGDKVEALKLLLELALSPKCPLSALYECGSLLLEFERSIEAISVLERASVLAPISFNVLHDLATAYAQAGRIKEALEKYRLASSIEPNSPELLYNIGRLHDELHQEAIAIEFYQKAVALNAQFSQAWINMGLNFNYLGNYEEGFRNLKKGFELNPQVNFVFGDLIHSQMHLCEWSSFQKNIKAIVDGIENNQKIIYPFHLLSLVDSPELQKKAAQIFSNEKFPLATDNYLPKVGSHKKIRIGYFSADFRNHATAHLMAELFELHDKNQFELLAFSYGLRQEDAMRRRLRLAFDEFIDIAQMSDDDALSLVRSKELDIAIDLSGHTQDARTNLFARRMAPVQINYLVYPGTMGTKFHDYIIADSQIIPKGFEQFYTEKVLLLPNCYQANDRKKIISNLDYSRDQLGLPQSGFVFCSFNNSYKINPMVFDLWMKILSRVDDSVLWLLGDSQVLMDNLRREAIARGVDGKRICFASKVDHAEHLARQKSADLILDTFPYNAHTTASDALWAGLPLITKRGESFASRVAASLLESMDLSELIVNSEQEYVDLAVKLAVNPELLTHFKSRLRENLQTSPLFNTPQLARELESLYLQILEQSK